MTFPFVGSMVLRKDGKEEEEMDQPRLAVQHGSLSDFFPTSPPSFAPSCVPLPSQRSLLAVYSLESLAVNRGNELSTNEESSLKERANERGDGISI